MQERDALAYRLGMHNVSGERAYAYGTLVQRPPCSCQGTLAADSMGRWGEYGLAGISDDKQRLCFSLVLWNGQDPIAPAT